MKWRGNEALGLVRGEAGKRVDAALRVVRDAAKIAISREQPSIIRVSKNTGQRYRVGLDPSKKGEPPKKLSGWLRLNVRKEFDPRRIEGRVGTNTPYGKVHELGDHPWLAPTLYATAAELQRRFGIGVTI